MDSTPTLSSKGPEFDAAKVGKLKFKFGDGELGGGQ